MSGGLVCWTKSTALLYWAGPAGANYRKGTLENAVLRTKQGPSPKGFPGAESMGRWTGGSGMLTSCLHRFKVTVIVKAYSNLLQRFSGVHHPLE